MDYCPGISAQETKQGFKQNNLLVLTVLCEKSCLIRRNKNFWFRFITRLLALYDKRFKTTTERKKQTKKQKNNGTYNTFHGLLSQKWIDGRY